MALISEIKMSMSLATAGVTTALGKAKAGVSNFATSANEKLGSLAKLVSGALLMAFVAFAKKAVDLGSELSDIATSTGFATEEFQVFRGALIDAGGNAGAMEKAINNMQKAVVQGSEGLSTYVRAFERLGLSVEELRQMSPEEQFKTLGMAIATAGDRQAAYTSAMEIFGTKVAPRMMEVFDRLAKDGYQKMAKDVEEAYGIMDAATQKSLDKAADTIEQFKSKATIEVGQLISGEADFAAFKELGARFMALMAQVGEWMANALIGAVQYLGAALGAVALVFQDNFTKVFELAGAVLMKAVAPVINALSEGLNKLGFDLGIIDTDEVQATIDKINFNNPAEDWKKFNSALLDGMGDWSISTQGAQDAWSGLADTYGNIADTSGVVEMSLAAQQKAAIELAAKSALAAVAAAEKAKAEAEIATKQGEQLNLAQALASGDHDAIRMAQEQISMRDQISKLVKATGIDEEVARDIIERQNALLDEQADQRLELLKAQLAGDDIAIRAAEQKIALEETALQIMKDTNVSYTEAIILAEKWLRMMAGADLNNSGFTTTFEQREWDRIQAERQDILDDALAAEEREQREQGGNIENVSAEKAETGSVWDRAAAAKEQRLRDAENDRLNRIRDPEERAKALAEIEEDRRQRELAQKLENAENEMEKQKLLDAEAERKRLEDLGLVKDADGNFINKDGQAVDDQGNVLPEPKAPQTLDDVVEKMAEIHKTIKSIDKSLKCDP